MGQTQTIEDRLKQFVVKQFPLARRGGAMENTNWLENGMIDSLGILDLVHFLETEFSIQICDEELVPENFQSLVNLVNFTREKISLETRQQ